MCPDVGSECHTSKTHIFSSLLCIILTSSLFFYLYITSTPLIMILSPLFLTDCFIFLSHPLAYLYWLPLLPAIMYLIDYSRISSFRTHSSWLSSLISHLQLISFKETPITPYYQSHPATVPAIFNGGMGGLIWQSGTNSAGAPLPFSARGN